ncbi:MAG: AmmeMemoRadiSam system radical SAM enzyme [Acidobacteria bacterium]|nr:AmmeMemoRadiSam system radical SAM enzyme [Acidobacteriota bacterium]
MHIGLFPDGQHEVPGCDRRSFLKGVSLPCLAACTGALAGTQGIVPLLAADSDAQFIREAQFYEKQPYRKIKCKLCPRECVIDDHERGYCGARENRGGTYYTLVHSRVATAHIDPIEKKPFFHFLPGAMAFSIATAGCNVNCKMCQNWEISQVRPEQVRSSFAPPARIAELARQNRCPVVAYTYSEPVIFYEYMTDTARAAHEAGVRSVVVTGGYVSPDPLTKLCKTVDAIKVDLKAYSEKFYKEIVNGEMKHVLKAIETIQKRGTWNEIVYLLIPTLNDSAAELQALAKWVKTDLGPDVPLHFSRFHPEYLLKNLPPTPLATLERAKAIADAEGLHYVYVGNVPGHPAESTYCPKCHKLIVERAGYTIGAMHIKGGKCRYCQQAIPGVWS